MSKGMEARLKMLLHASEKRVKEYESIIEPLMHRQLCAISTFVLSIVIGGFGILLSSALWFSFFLVGGATISIWYFYKVDRVVRRMRGYKKLYGILARFIKLSFQRRNISPFILNQCLKAYNYLENRQLSQDLLLENHDSLQSISTNIG